MIDLEVPRRFRPLVAQARAVGEEVFRPISRKYDLAEHEYPRELDLLAAVIEGQARSGASQGAGASGAGGTAEAATAGTRNGSNLASVLSIMQACWGDVGLTLSIPRQGLGNAAISAVATEEQQARYAGRWAAMAITEPEAGSDAAAIRTTAVRDGDWGPGETGDYILNGEKIFVTSGERAELVVVWATLDRSLGRRAIRSFVVERANPGLKLVRLEHKLGIRSSDTAAFHLDDCRVPSRDLLGDPEIRSEGGFGGAMQTFDNTRPLVAGMAVGLARGCLDTTTALLADEGVQVDWDRPAYVQHAAAARLMDLEADYQSAYLLTLRAAWMADNARPNSMEASMAKAKAGRTCVDIALACVELCGATGYAEHELLEKWARDAKILDIFEGTQQIQLLVVARRLLGLSSSELV